MKRVAEIAFTETIYSGSVHEPFITRSAYHVDRKTHLLCRTLYQSRALWSFKAVPSTRCLLSHWLTAAAWCETVGEDESEKQSSKCRSLITKLWVHAIDRLVAFERGSMFRQWRNYGSFKSKKLYFFLKFSFKVSFQTIFPLKSCRRFLHEIPVVYSSGSLIHHQLLCIAQSRASANSFNRNHETWKMIPCRPQYLAAIFFLFLLPASIYRVFSSQSAGRRKTRGEHFLSPGKGEKKRKIERPTFSTNEKWTSKRQARDKL